MSQSVPLTRESFDALQEELKRLIREERPKVIQDIAEARAHGDLSENAEYDAAKDAQGMLEAKIAVLQDQIAGARIIDQSKIDTDVVQIMNKVTIKNVKNNAVMVYTIVSEHESDLKLARISVSTPIAKGLLGKKVGDVVEIQVPSGVIPFEIINIELGQ